MWEERCNRRIWCKLYLQKTNAYPLPVATIEGEGGDEGNAHLSNLQVCLCVCARPCPCRQTKGEGVCRGKVRVREKGARGWEAQV